MKRIALYISTALIILVSTSCAGFLDKEVDLSMSESQVFGNKENTRYFLANIYTNLPDLFQGFGDTQSWGGFKDAMTDNAVSYWDVHFWNSVLIDSYDATNHPFSVNSTRGFWIPNVQAIRKTNQFLKNAREEVIGNAAMSGDDNHLYERNIAEAKLLRAMFHFELCKWFGPTPIIAEDENGVPIVFDLSNSAQMNMSRTAPAEALKWVADQCDLVKDKLPFRYSEEEVNWGRVNGATAYAMKARALLYRASPLNNPSNDQSWWAEAAQAAKDFIAKNSSMPANQQYRLYDVGDVNKNYYECFCSTDPTRNNEYIICRSVWRVTTIETEMSPCGFAGVLTCVGRFNPTENFVQCYEMKDGKPIYDPVTGDMHPNYDPANPYANRDPRLDQTIIHEGTLWGDKQEEEERKVDVTSPAGKDYQSLHGGTLTGYYSKKFNYQISYTNPSTPTHAAPLYRYGEILLNAAEALNESQGPEAAYEYVNKVRARVGMPPYSGMTKEQLRERIRNERRIELFSEDHRWHDARRWKIYEGQTPASEMSKPKYQQYYNLWGVRVTNHDAPKFEQMRAEKRPSLVFNSPKNYYLPLPDSEVKRAPNLKQNPGWELSASSAE